MSALAFTILAVMLVGPVPGPAGARDVAAARSARRDGAVAGDCVGRSLVRVQRRHRDRQPVVRCPAPTGGPPPARRREIGRLGWPLWLPDVAVFALTVLIGARLVVAVMRVAVVDSATSGPSPHGG